MPHTHSSTLLLYPNSQLEQPAAHVNLDDPTLRSDYQCLQTAFTEHPGQAISAPQIGIPKRIIAYDFSEKENNDCFTCNILINPILVDHSKDVIQMSEACKSFPGIRISITRHARITLQGQSPSGNKVTEEFFGPQAALMQHHLDHLEGKLLIDHVSPTHRTRYSWYLNNIQALTHRLSPTLNTPDNSVIYNENNAIILRTGDVISLYFAEPGDEPDTLKFSGVMSTINLRYPLVLSNIYSQALMLALIFCPHAQSLYMLGFGGGIVPMSFYHYLPEITINGSEIDETVGMLAESYFGVKKDERINFEVIDGELHLKQLEDETFDIILLDTFSGAGHHPDNLATYEFYELCKSRLSQQGVIGTNLVNSDPKFATKMQTFHEAFKYVYSYEHEQGNYVCFGSNHADLAELDIIQKAQALHANYDFMFPFIDRARQVKKVV